MFRRSSLACLLPLAPHSMLIFPVWLMQGAFCSSEGHASLHPQQSTLYPVSQLRLRTERGNVSRWETANKFVTGWEDVADDVLPEFSLQVRVCGVSLDHESNILISHFKELAELTRTLSH